MHLFEKYAQLKAKGISPYWCIHHGITVSMYYRDPDGNQMEFQVDSFSSNEDANAFINGSFSVNPVGVEYDPDDWLALLRAAAPASDFLVRQIHEPVFRSGLDSELVSAPRHGLLSLPDFVARSRRSRCFNSPELLLRQFIKIRNWCVNSGAHPTD